MAIPGHNMVMVLFGCMLTLVGWMGLDTAGAMLFAGASTNSIALIAVNNVVAASIALLTALIVTGIRFGKPDASITANGFVIGMVAISGVCSLVSPAEAAAIGLVAGCWFHFRWNGWTGSESTTPAVPISVHAVGGLWGVIATGAFYAGPSRTMAGADGDALGTARICSSPDLLPQSALEPHLSATHPQGWRAARTGYVRTRRRGISGTHADTKDFISNAR